MNSIERDIVKNLGETTLPKNIATRLESKFGNLRSWYGINFDNTILTLEDNPDLYNQFDELPGLSNFFRRHIDIWLEHEGQEGLVYSKKYQDWILAARKPLNMALYNPETDKVESWSRITSVSKFRKDHHLKAGSPKKSRFNGDYTYIKPIEYTAFNQGLGILVKQNLLRIYLGFESPIGKSRKGVPQKYICLECERVRRRQNTKAKVPKKVYGFKVNVHGYPVEAVDIKIDFRDTPLKIAMVPVVNS